MNMQRYFLSSSQIHDATLQILGTDVHHIKNVMRMSLGESLEAVDETGRIFECVISALEKEAVVCQITSYRQSVQHTPHLHLAQALIRRERFEWVLEKATELHVEKILPTQFERSIVKSSDNAFSKLSRYESIAKEASEQSHRDVLPTITTPFKLKDLPYEQYDDVLVCYEKEVVSNHIHKVIEQIKPSHHVLIIIGPEGGISESELSFLESRHAKFVSLGELILRSETASVYVLSAFLSHWGL